MSYRPVLVGFWDLPEWKISVLMAGVFDVGKRPAIGLYRKQGEEVRVSIGRITEKGYVPSFEKLAFLDGESPENALRGEARALSDGRLEEYLSLVLDGEVIVDRGEIKLTSAKPAA